MNTEVIISIVAVVVILAIIAFFMMHKKDNYTVPALNTTTFYDWLNTSSQDVVNWLASNSGKEWLNSTAGKIWSTTTPVGQILGESGNAFINLSVFDSDMDPTA